MKNIQINKKHHCSSKTFSVDQTVTAEEFAIIAPEMGFTSEQIARVVTDGKGISTGYACDVCALARGED